MRLFEDECLPDDKTKKQVITYSEMAYKLAVRLIEKSKSNNFNYFNHIYNEYGEKQKILFTKSCNCIQAIYDGKFLNPKLYSLSKKFLSNKSFRIDMKEVQSKLEEVKGDWVKVKKLIFIAYENFALMHNSDYVPCDKKYLTKILDQWFYGYSDEAGKFQSQFLQCLETPMKTPEFYSEKKADGIYETLSTNIKFAGNKFYELNPNMNSGVFWENIKKLVEWAKLVLTSDENAHYWVSNPSEIIEKYYQFCVERNISVNTNTLDIQKCIDCNGPFVWFVQEGIENHGLNNNLLNCVSPEDFVDCYNNNKVSFDDMDEVLPF